MTTTENSEWLPLAYAICRYCRGITMQTDNDISSSKMMPGITWPSLIDEIVLRSIAGQLLLRGSAGNPYGRVIELGPSQIPGLKLWSVVAGEREPIATDVATTATGESFWRLEVAEVPNTCRPSESYQPATDDERRYAAEYGNDGGQRNKGPRVFWISRERFKSGRAAVDMPAEIEAIQHEYRSQYGYELNEKTTRFHLVQFQKDGWQVLKFDFDSRPRVEL